MNEREIMVVSLGGDGATLVRSLERAGYRAHLVGPGAAPSIPTGARPTAVLVDRRAFAATQAAEQAASAWGRTGLRAVVVEAATLASAPRETFEQALTRALASPGTLELSLPGDLTQRIDDLVGAAMADLAGAVVAEVVPTVPAETPAAPASRPIAANGAGARVRQLEARVEEGNYFEILGLGRDATREEVRRAYGELIAALGELPSAPAAEPRLALIRAVLDEARAVLEDDDTRASYLAHLRD